MKRAPETRTEELSHTDRTDRPFYLPAVPALSGTSGRVERFLTRLLRRRGRLRAVVRPRNR